MRKKSVWILCAGIVCNSLGQEILLILGFLYLLAICLTILAGSTILVGAAISLFIVNPVGVYLALHRTQKDPQPLTSVVVNALYLLCALLLATLTLFVVTNVWNPDQYVYGLDIPLWRKIFVLVQLEFPWLLAGGILTALLPLVLPPALLNRCTDRKRKRFLFF